MLDKKINIIGQKDYQRENNEDRALIYRKWLRTIKTNGFFIDIDLVKCKYENGEIVPVAVTELSRTDSFEVGEKYLDAVEERLFERDKQAKIILILAERLGVPAYFVLFNKNCTYFWVLDLENRIWTPMSEDYYIEWIRSL